MTTKPPPMNWIIRKQFRVVYNELPEGGLQQWKSFTSGLTKPDTME